MVEDPPWDQIHQVVLMTPTDLMERMEARVMNPPEGVVEDRIDPHTIGTRR